MLALAFSLSNRALNFGTVLYVSNTCAPIRNGLNMLSEFGLLVKHGSTNRIQAALGNAVPVFLVISPLRNKLPSY